MARVLFSAENAKLFAQKSVEARKQRKQAAQERQTAIVTVLAQSQSTDLNGASRSVKAQISEEILGQLALLRSNVPLTQRELANSPDGEGRASLVARITDTASKVYGWDQEKGNSLVIIGLVSSMDPDQPSPEPAIDVESKPV